MALSDSLSDGFQIINPLASDQVTSILRVKLKVYWLDNNINTEICYQKIDLYAWSIRLKQQYTLAVTLTFE